MMNKRIEHKINRWYDGTLSTRVWAAKQWYRWITYGCSMCYTDKCNCSAQSKNIYDPKGFGEIAEYCYDNYGEAFKK